MAAAWKVIEPAFFERRRSDFARLNDYIRLSGDTRDSGTAGPSLALRRRISRESGPATRAIELGARLLLDGLAFSHPSRRVVIRDVDRADTLTLRVLARAAVLLTDAHDVSFVWTTTADPNARRGSSLVETARRVLLHNALKFGAFSLRLNAVGQLSSRAVADRSLTLAAVDLVAHNYESTLLACGQDQLHGVERPESLRLAALAAINLGELDDAEALLRDALVAGIDPVFRAHVYCLLALMTTKRRDDVAASDALITAGFDELVTDTASTVDADLERAWLFNARALNSALMYRRTLKTTFLQQAHSLELTAFELVARGGSDERVYLRFNLLANMAFLWERERPLKAVQIFQDVFDKRPTHDPVARAILSYRLGVLYARAKCLDEAAAVLASVDLDLPAEEWCSVEYLLRARSRVALELGHTGEAEELATRGYELALESRSSRAASAHGHVLVHVLQLTHRAAAAEAIADQLLSFGLDPFGPVSTAALPPKLPAYIPEIDLEDVPLHDTNSKLASI